MKRIIRLIIVFLILIVSCKTTLMQDALIDENYNKQINKVFIIGVSERADNRKIFENEFVRQLVIRGIDAVPSYQILTDKELLDEDTILSKIRGLKIDAVIITKIIARRKDYYQQISSRYSSDLRYYIRSYSAPDKGRASQDIVSLETSLYDAETERLVWSALSETFIFSAPAEALKPFIETVIKNMSEDNILKERPIVEPFHY